MSTTDTVPTKVGLCCLLGALLGVFGCGKVAADTAHGDSSIEAGAGGAGDAGVDAGADAGVGDARVVDASVDVAVTKDAPPPDAGGGCTIDGKVYANNERNPVRSCESCRTVLSTSMWEYVPDGLVCDGGKCFEGECMPLACPTGCGSNEDCAMWCPPMAGTISCCDTGSGVCFMTGQPACPAPPPPSQCPLPCKKDLDCQTQCIGFSLFCCDAASETCMASATDQCPASADAG